MKQFLLTLMLAFSLMSFQQQNEPKPKLVIGVIVDQMRYDYLTQFAHHYGDDGFKRLLKEGFNVENGHFNYIPTKTAAGHASVFTGTTPANHGILGNDFYDKFQRKMVYCVADENYQTVGGINGGMKSPNRMKTTTLSDQLNLHQYKKGKVIGIAIKDRSAILPAGHTANAAYWFEGRDEGKFISSSYYMNELPEWVEKFNKSGIAEDYANSIWDTYYPIKKYTSSLEDNNPYEGKFAAKDQPTFPYDLSELREANNNFDLIKATVFGNSITTDFAIAAIKGEKLGSSDYIDFLSVSYSSTDYIGHQFGVDSKEIEDTYVRLDLEIARLLKTLDKKVGKGNYTLFLTADHAAVRVPQYLIDEQIPGGYNSRTGLRAFLSELTQNKYGRKDLIENISNEQIFLNDSILKSAGIDRMQAGNYIAQELVNYKDVYKAVSAQTMQESEFSSGILHLLQMGYNQKYSGDILYVNMPNQISYSRTGSTHGSGYNYDTHVPIIFFGNGIKPGRTKSYFTVTDIVPTISNLLGITFSNANSGLIIDQALK